MLLWSSKGLGYSNKFVFGWPNAMLAGTQQLCSGFLLRTRIFNLWDLCDYGYSGLNFNRLAFTRLLEDIDSGKINLVITKDLSRLGRNYIQTGYYTDVYFSWKRVLYQHTAPYGYKAELKRQSLDRKPRSHWGSERNFPSCSIGIQLIPIEAIQQGHYSVALVGAAVSVCF